MLKKHLWEARDFSRVRLHKESIILQEGETSAFKWVTGDELRKMSRDEIATQRIQNFMAEKRKGFG